MISSAAFRNCFTGKGQLTPPPEWEELLQQLGSRACKKTSDSTRRSFETVRGQALRNSIPLVQGVRKFSRGVGHGPFQAPTLLLEAMTPLVTDWSLSKGKRQKAWSVPHISGRDVQYAIATTGDMPAPTAGSNSARCLFTGDPITFDYLRAEVKRGRRKPQLFAMVGDRNGQRALTCPDSVHVRAAFDVRGFDVPDVVLPEKALGFRVQAYGFKRFGDLSPSTADANAQYFL